MSTRKAQRHGERRDNACTHPLGRQVVGRVPRELARKFVGKRDLKGQGSTRVRPWRGIASGRIRDATHIVLLQRAFLRRLGVGEADRGERRAGRRVRLVIDAGDRGANRDWERRLHVGALQIVQDNRLKAGGRKGEMVQVALRISVVEDVRIAQH